MGLKKLLNNLRPPSYWLFYVNLLIAFFVGIFVYALYVSNAVSYLSDEPETCVNCHVMWSEFATWQHSSHREVAVCNDCHVPHNNVFNKYYFKAKDGLRHATMFTLRMEPQVIKMHEAGQEVVQKNCQGCHQRINQDVGLLTISLEDKMHGDGKLCWDCHREVPHGRVKGLNSAPNSRVPLPGSPVPKFIRNLNTKNK
ncbi:MAG: cytochrome c nitrite reductase small subunit [Cyclobacteriaceae bacterium]|nr:cytochrome c nitrite reductase small subunit [Cyclobacteriaceae bacterium]